MLPTNPANGAAQTQTAPTVQQMGFNPMQFTPNPTLGDKTRNRDWAKREAQLNYEMAQAPLPHQYTTASAHPMFGGGSGSPLTQWLPQGQPTGFAANKAPVLYSNPGTAPMVRPTYAYNNRLVGINPRQPTMYVGTWPNQQYPAGSNTYIPNWEATGIIIKFTRDASKFRINKYLKFLTVPKDQGYYLTLDADNPYRIINPADWAWEDGADAPGGRGNKQGFGFQPYKTSRMCFPFTLGQKSVTQAEWPIVAEHAMMAACQAMTLRTIVSTALLTNTANWTGSFGTNTSAQSAQWTNAASNTSNAIQTDINTAMIAIEQASGGIVTDEEALNITLNPVTARGIAKSYEYKQYIQGSPDALAAITDQRNPNRKYGLAPYLYGLALVVENAIQVTTPKSDNVASPLAQSRSYIWANQYVNITSKPTGLVGEDQQTLDFSTVAMRSLENLTTETKADPDNRRETGRVVDEFCTCVQAPQTGYLITGVT